MTQTIKAIYQNGNFKPLTPVPEEFDVGKVKLVVKNEIAPGKENPIMKLAKKRLGLSEEAIQEIERIALDGQISSGIGNYERGFI
jgi:predicted DNA-binding antitoxin AbrB/MazE fold protein